MEFTENMVMMTTEEYQNLHAERYKLEQHVKLLETKLSFIKMTAEV